jgi:hypothetical protein
MFKTKSYIENLVQKDTLSSKEHRQNFRYLKVECNSLGWYKNKTNFSLQSLLSQKFKIQGHRKIIFFRGLYMSATHIETVNALRTDSILH